MPKASIAVATNDLRVGMFVVALDRALSGTPFLDDEFLINDTDQINQLQFYCSNVEVDPLRSTAESLTHLGDLRATDRRHDREIDERFSEHIAALYPEVRTLNAPSPPWRVASNRMRAWWRREVFSRVATPVSRRATRHRSRWIPKDMDLVIYRDVSRIENEIQRARESFSSSVQALDEVTHEAARNEPVHLAPVGRAAEALVASVAANPDALMWLARMREENVQAYKHSVKVAIYMVTAGRAMGFAQERLQRLAMVGLLLDVGKIHIADRILASRGALSDKDLAEMRRHVEYGLDDLSTSAHLHEDVYTGIAQHHERIDGSGYPHALTSESIGTYGRLSAIADSFAALTSPRPYAPPMSAYDAMKVLYAGAGSAFSEPLVDEFVRAVGIFPVGSLVELSTGEVAAVVHHHHVRQLQPRILVLTDGRKVRQPPRSLDLLAEPRDDEEQVIHIVRGLPSGAYGLEPKRLMLG